MDLLPSSVESYLQEAGFSGTELFVLKRLMEDDAMTLREMAIKTGKSTGVLDQAVKKLIKKGIVERTDVNGHPKYGLHSLNAVREWMEEDMQHKQDMLLRKQRNFDAFISSLAKDKERPEMEHFDGLEGIKQAYMALLEKNTKEFLMYVPVTCKEEDDELRDFRVQYFRERRRRGIFSRVLAHDTPLGNRYRNRDPFEYRKTILLPEEEYPFTFEQIIAGNTIACFNHPEHKVCFIHYPHLVQSQRYLFESLWRTGEKGKKVTTEEIKTLPAPSPVPFPTRTASSLREFFLGRNSLIIFGLCAILAAALTYGLYQQNLALNLQQMRVQVQGIASTGALQFDAKDLDQLRVESDWKKPQWAKVVNQLIAIRKNNSDLYYAYIFRRTESDPQKMEFVADSHSINPYANIDEDPTNDMDLNRDGKIDNAVEDTLFFPGYPYPEVQKEGFLAYEGSITSQLYEDQYGAVLSGYEPIKDANGRVSGILAVDIKAEKLNELSQNTFSPLLSFVLIFLAFVLIRLTAFNRSLFKELWELLQMRKVLIICAVCSMVAAAVTYAFYVKNRELNLQQMRVHVQGIASTAALQFDAKDLDQLRVAADWKKPEWKKVVNQLKQIRLNNDDIFFAYIFRRLPTDPNKLEFVSDSHSINPYANTDDNQDNNVDVDHDGKITDIDVLQWPGQPYPVPSLELFRGFEGPTASYHPYTDSWGSYISGYAPVKDESGRVSGVVAVDIRANKLTELSQDTFSPPLWFALIFLTLFLILLVAFLSFFKKYFLYLSISSDPSE